MSDERIGLHETTDLTDMVAERTAPLAGQVSSLRSQVRELKQELRDNRDEDRDLRKRLAKLEQIAASVRPEVTAAINAGLRQPLERVEESLKKDIVLQRDRMEMADKELRTLVDDKAGKTDLKTLTGRLWTLAAAVLLAVIGSVYKLLGLG